MLLSQCALCEKHGQARESCTKYRGYDDHQRIHAPLCLQRLSQPDVAHLCLAIAFETFSY